MALLFKRKYLWGAVVFLLGVAFSIANTHLQITYYLLLLCFFVYLGYLFNKLKEKAYKELGTVTAIMAGLCVRLELWKRGVVDLVGSECLWWKFGWNARPGF